MMPPDNRIRWWTPLFLLVASILSGAIFGILTNVINSRISLNYFEIVLKFNGPVVTERQRIIEQGIFEGSISGAIFGFVLSLVIGISSLLKCPITLAARFLAEAFAFVFVTWLLSGIIGVVLSHLAPQLWGTIFIPVPSGVDLSRFAWVGGTIDGAYLGVLLSLIIFSIRFHRRWRRIFLPPHGFDVLPANESDR